MLLSHFEASKMSLIFEALQSRSSERLRIFHHFVTVRHGSVYDKRLCD